MPPIDPELPNRLSELALYASLVAIGVIGLNVSLVKAARWLSGGRPRPRAALRSRPPRR